LHVGGDYVKPLPAEEQLALLFHLAERSPRVGVPHEPPPERQISLPDAYRSCHAMIRQHSKSFFFSSQLLPPAKRQAVRALYAFCRTSDDTVDMAEHDPAHELAAWVRLVRAPQPPGDNPVLLAWYDTCHTYNLAPELTAELLAGVAMDLTIHRYTTFADLWLYCYRVASVVGLLSMGIIGHQPQAEPYAIKLGVALQMTNILRDVGEDARRGRVYLPQEDLERFGLTAQDILDGVHDERFVALMRFEIARTRTLYEESWPGIALLSTDGRLAIGAAARVYRGILDKIEANNYDSHNRRAFVPLREKFFMLPRIWRDVRRL
jgi:phytoene synthase